jgi:hypothetical protein
MNFRYIFYITLVISLSAQTQVVVKEVMFIDAPYVGEVTTTTSKYAADGLFRQEASIEVDRFLIRLAMGGNKSLGSILNGKTESRIVYNAKDEEYAMETFDTIRVNDGIPTLKATTGRMNMGGGSGGGRGNDNSDEEEEKAEFDRTISKLLERMPGFDARKVTTKIKGKNGIILVEEWFTTDTTLLQFVSEVEADLVASYGGQKQNNPRSFSERMLKQAEQEFESVPGRMVKYTMEMTDDDNGFKMVWELKSIREVPFNMADFKIPSDYEKVDELD